MKTAGSLRVPLIDLRAQYQSIQPEIDAAIARVVQRGQFILGAEGESLEREVAALCETTHGVGVASGTDALELSLRACGIGPGDEVLTTAFSFFATVEAIVAVGATPVFVDIEPQTYNLDVRQLDSKCTSRTKAILPVHLYGHPCDMDAVLRIAQARRLPIIEDCAQAIGATYRGRPVGSFGIAGCFSFFPSKNLGAYGDGGMIVTRDADVAQRLRVLRVHGSVDRYRHEIMGTNSRLDELQAAILRAKLPHLQSWNAARRQHAHTYRELIREQGITGLQVPMEAAGCEPVYHLFVIRCQQRDRVLERLREQGVGAQVHYPISLPDQPVLARAGFRVSQYPVAQQAAQDVLSLPLYPEMSTEQLRAVVEALHNALKA